MKRNVFLGLLLLGAVAGLAACSHSRSTPSPAPVPSTAAQAPAATLAATSAVVVLPTPAAPSPTTPAATRAPTAAVAPGDATALPGEATAGPPGAGTVVPTPDVQADLPPFNLDALSSYAIQVEMRDEAVGANKATPAPPQTMLMQYRGQAKPDMYAWTYSSGPQSGVPDSKSVRIGADLYTFDPTTNKWIHTPANDDQADLPTKEDVLDPMRIALAAPIGLFNKANIVNAHEKLNGVDTTHYRANPGQLHELLQGASDANRTATGGSADFWVENKNGYLKQYVMVANLQDQQGKQYRQTIKFTLSNENKPVNIATPDPKLIVDQMPEGTPQATP